MTNVQLLSCAVGVCVAHVLEAQPVKAVTAHRDKSTGAIVVEGKTSLPGGTRLRIWVNTTPDTVIATLDSRGWFTSAVGALGRPVLDTAMTVHLSARFTAADQPPHVIRQTGSGATSLPNPASDLHADDPARPAGSRHLKVAAPVTVAAIPDAVYAKRLEIWTRDSVQITARPIIERLKNTVFERADGQKSSVNVQSAIHWHEWIGKFTSDGWSAEHPSPTEWILTLTGRAPKNQVAPRWSYNTERNLVVALDSLASVLAYRRIPAVECARNASALLATFPDSGRAAKVQVTRIVILPLPAPEAVKPYFMTAEFAVDASGKGELIEWNAPSDPAWAKNVLKTLQGYLFAPALDHAGKPTCALTVVRASVGLPPYR